MKKWLREFGKFLQKVPSIRYINVVEEDVDLKTFRPIHTLKVKDRVLVIDGPTLEMAKQGIMQVYGLLIRTFVFGFISVWFPPIALFLSAVIVILTLGCIKFGKDNGKITNGIYDAGIFAYVSLSLWNGIMMYVFGRALGNLIESRYIHPSTQVSATAS